MGGLLSLRAQVAEQVGQLRQLRQELAELQRSAEQRLARLEELRLLLDDVAAAQLRPEEEQELVQERSVLLNAARISELVNHAYYLLSKGDESGAYPVRPVLATIKETADNLVELARLDPSAGSIAEQATDLLYRLEDLAVQVRTYHDSLDFEPGRLEQIEDRLAFLRSMQRKHGGTITQILERAASAEAEIERLSHSDEYRATLAQQETALLAEIGAIASTLSHRRRETGETLARAVEGAMQDLAMPYVRFSVQMEQTEDPTGVPLAVEEPGPENDTMTTAIRTCQITATGIDRVEFLLSPNPGEPLKPLVRIASGGESARLLLALKSILSHVDMIPTLIFDEIDIGVGGRAAQVVGQKLWAMSENHQVVCITHMAQVAAFADTHYAISKAFVPSTTDGTMQTHTQVQRLSLDEQREELAAMLDGTPVSDYSRASATDMIERAQRIKSGARRACNDRQP